MNNKKVFTLLVVFSFMFSLLASCGTTAAPTEKPPEPTAVPPTKLVEEPTEIPEPTETPKSGKLVVGIAWEPSSIDPHVTSSFEGAIVDRAVFDTLIRQAMDGSYHPGLATDWSVSDDGLVYTFNLKEGVTFHDGTPFTASVVQYSLDRIVNPDTMSESAVDLLGPYESTEIVDDYTVKVHLSQPFGPFINGLARSIVAMVSPDAAEEWGEEFDDHLVGSGPFIFKEWVRGDHITLARNPDYNWGTDYYDHQGQAYLEEITIKFISESTVRSGVLETGEVHMINEVPAEDYVRFEADDAYDTFNIDQPGAPLSIAMNVTKAPLDELKVRQALIYAIDKQVIVDTLFAGLYPVSYSTLTPNTQGYWEGSKDLYSYDPEKAKALLEEAGWVDSDGDGIRDRDGQAFELVWPTFTWQKMNMMAEMVQAQLLEVGINLTVDVVAFPSMYETANNCEHNLVHSGFEGTDPRVLETVYYSENVGSGWAWTCIKDDKIDELLIQGRETTNESERIAIYTEIQQIVLENALIIPVRMFTNLFASLANVQGLLFEPEGYLTDFYDVYITE
ncbi:MAG: ABC transporter substrate-binding protein [Anaerolineales bacterium]|nr:ABC transporter substrate-binding protein [Anaerolineales bacterium]